jgi:hypothetical protein
MLTFKEFLEEKYKNTPSVYYAHPMTDYNKPKEKRVVSSLKKMGYRVDNPNTQKHQNGYRLKGMKHFTDASSRANAVVFTRFPNRKIGAGVGAELDTALRKGKRAYEMIKKGQLHRITHVPKPDVMNQDDTIKTRKKFRTVDHGSKKYDINWKKKD